MWQVVLRGGAYDGFGGMTENGEEPPAVVVAFRHQGVCLGHVSFDPFHPGIVLATAETYRRVERDGERRVAVFEVGESWPGPGVEERAWMLDRAADEAREQAVTLGLMGEG